MSSNPPASPVSSVVDTVILRYFLLVDRTELLLSLLGSPLGVSRVVYDPDESGAPPDAMSEMTRAIFDQGRRAQDDLQPDDIRGFAAKRRERLHAIHSLYGLGHIATLDMTDEERATFATLTSRPTSADLLFPLAAGEAATIAIALHRSLTCATDDSDGLHALEVLSGGHPYERIRKLLQRAATTKLISRADANNIHREMRSAGFWDKHDPFPGE